MTGTNRPRTLARHLPLTGPLACLFLVQADCGRGAEPFEIEITDSHFFLSGYACYHIEKSLPPPGYHECAPAPFASERTCVDEVKPHFEASIQAASEAGLVFAEDCFVHLHALGGPPKVASGTWFDCANDCQFFHGDLPEGASCESFGHRMSDCAQGLVCAPDRTCHRPCTYSFTAPEGGFCGPARGMWFVTCDAGLACGADGTCEPAVAIGAVCDSATPCAVEGWCDPDTSSCVARSTAPSPCVEHEQCVSDLCVDGLCIEPQWPECGRWGW